MRGPLSDLFDRGGWPNISVFMKTWSDICDFLDDPWYYDSRDEQANCLNIAFIFSSSSQWHVLICVPNFASPPFSDTPQNIYFENEALKSLTHTHSAHS